MISTRAPVGSLGILGVPATTNQGCKGLVFDLRVLEPRYFYFLIQSGIPYMNACAQGATFVELSGFQLRDMKIFCPPKHIQRAIVAHIEKETARIVDKIEKTKKELNDYDKVFYVNFLFYQYNKARQNYLRLNKLLLFLEF